MGGLLLLLLGCEPSKPTADSAACASTWYADLDDDGYGDPEAPTEACEAPVRHVASAGDCDDDDARVSPDASETCDGEDDDCDGEVDEDPTDPSTLYTDADGDGFGDAAAPVTACEGSEGLVAEASDCDDTDPAVSPAAEEDCATPTDDDCDGRTDDEGAIGCTEHYADQDGDGYGGVDTACLCSAADPYLPTAGDCDDDDADAHPAADDTCDDGLDQDCDGADDACPLEGTLDVGTAAVTLVASPTALAAGDLDDDGSPDLLVGMYGTTVYAASGPLGSVTVTDLDTAIGPTAGVDDLGVALDAGEDVDGDGREDWAAGAPDTDGAAYGAGAVYLFTSAPPSGGAGTDSAARTYEGTARNDGFGNAVALFPDLDGDGRGELLVGASAVDDNADAVGAAYFFPGSATGGSTPADTADGMVRGDVGGDELGTAVANVGDLDGDGLADAAIGAPGVDLAATDAGAVYVFAGPIAGGLDPEDAAFTLTGAAMSDGLGSAIAGPGDVDGDGTVDLLLGVPDVGTGLGAAWLVLGGGLSGELAIEPTSAAVVRGTASADKVGISVAGPGDVDGDGLAEVLVGASGHEAGSEDGGAACLLYGAPSGAVSISACDALFAGDGAGDSLGEIVTALGDADGDGAADVLVAAPYDDAGGVNAGAIYLWYGVAR